MTYSALETRNETENGIRAPTKILYTAEVIATGGRSGQAQSSDRNLAVTLSVPRKMGGDSILGTNPEQLFAAAFAGSFEDALITAAKRQQIELHDPFIQARVGVGPVEQDAQGISVDLRIYLPGMTKAVAETLVAQAEAICPYANATRGNVPVRFVIENQPPLFQIH